MITAVIVDDEEKNREGLAKMLDQFCPDVRVVGKAENISSAKEIIQQEKPQVVFLDIEMPGGDGFSLIEEFEKPDFQVIFTTAHAAYAIKAIKFAALDFLLKPININELKVAIEKAIANYTNKTDTGLKQKINVLRENRTNDKFDFQKIALPTIDGIEYYAINMILRCEADRAYCKFYLSTGKQILVSKPLSEFEDLLTECNFFRIHKSNMVNLNHIKKYVRGSGGYVVLSDDSHVDVSVRRKEELMSILERK
ncbi:MAG: LytR/AlgR family response regulator transcription factor [Flavobacteriales bacterium]